nr:MAG TPA: Repressor protein CI [Bacteriophage sp.]
MFADKLRMLRKRKGLTQVQFAKDFDVSAGTIAMWETGKREPDFATTKRVADYFGVSVGYLIDDEKPVLERDGRDEELAFYLDRLTDDQKELLLAQMKVLVRSQE